MFANRVSWRKIIITLLTEVTAVNTTNLCHERKKSLLVMLQKNVCMQGRNILIHNPNPALPEKPHLQLSTMSKVSFWEFYFHNDTKIYLRLNENAHWGIGKKVPSFNAKRMSGKPRCDVTCKANVSHLDENVAALWVWLNSRKSDDVRTTAFSTITKSQIVRVTEKISLDLLDTIVATLQEVSENVYFIFNSDSGPYVSSIHI